MVLCHLHTTACLFSFLQQHCLHNLHSLLVNCIIPKKQASGMLCILVCLLSADFALAVLTAESLSIPCKAHSVQGVQYRKISWYKVIGPEYRGLVMKNLHDNHTTVYRGANHSYEVGAEFSLLLPEPALGDCGTYQCTLWPPLGHYIQEGQYEYYPAGCLRPTEALPMMPLPVTHFSCFDITRNLASWGIPAALILIIIIAGSVLYFYQRQKQYKLAETI
ncbi:hypothetical protein AALO_G00047870 [Alosa alosa]|uniref:Ig-like domain-containing protein n=1 Tax=Alosa alosa TaxID=278164 RepID=A0AAV6H325_9TELE|nr:uncharacterized protein LOC125292767 [Alosa alosa]KAG5281704.1 hypothetical protein AALO_G00047870 [Alosa alosa]